MIAALLWHFIPLSWLRSPGRRHQFASSIFSRAILHYERRAERRLGRVGRA